MCIRDRQKADAAARLLSGSYLLMLEERTDRLALEMCIRDRMLIDVSSQHLS